MGAIHQAMLATYGGDGGAAEEAWLQASTAGALRNNFSGWVGCQFTPSQDITVTHLGRIWLTGNSGSRTVEIWIPGGALKASAVIDLSAGVNDQYNYTAVTPVLLTSGQPYYISSLESSGGLQWREGTTAPSTCGHAVCDRAGFHESTANALHSGNAGQIFVPVNFKHT